MDNKSRKKLSQEDAETRLSKRLEGSGYTVNGTFVYKGSRDTIVHLYCPKHDYFWDINWTELIIRSKAHPYCGCKYCKIKYSKEVCIEAASKCSVRSEFAEKFEGEYMAALRNGWLNEICAHMTVVGNRYKRCIYAYEFPSINGSNYVYVGLTDYLEKRDKVHGTKGSVFEFCKKMNTERPKPKQLTDYIDLSNAAKLEGYYLNEYMIKGWIPINKKQTGGLGGHLESNGLSFDECKKIGSKYTKRSEWKKNDYPSYYIASKHKWINNILSQNERFGNSSQRFWTKARIFESALQFTTIRDFRAAYPSAYNIARKNGWLTDACKHMKRLYSATNYSVDLIINEINKYNNLTDFIRDCPSMYNWLNRHKIKLSDITNKEFKKNKGPVKTVYQYNLDGTFVRKYDCARDAVNYGFNYKDISAVCNGKKKSHKGFFFSFKDLRRK